MKTTELRFRSTSLLVSMISSVLAVRLFLLLFPGAGGATLMGLHVHHLEVGILLVVIGGIPAVLRRTSGIMNSVAVCTFGAGLGLALDEWLLLVVRERSPETAYMSPISLAGAAFFVVVVCAYTLWIDRSSQRSEDGAGPERPPTSS